MVNVQMPARMLLFVAVGQFLGLTLWFSATAAAPALAAEFGLTGSGIARIAADIPWRTLMAVSSSFALVDGALVWLAVEDGPYVTLVLLLVLAIVWGFSVVADSAQFSALVSEFSPRTHVGTALTLQTAPGFS